MNLVFFKALPFFNACSVIHAMLDEQGMRKMGMLASLRDDCNWLVIMLTQIRI